MSYTAAGHQRAFGTLDERKCDDMFQYMLTCRHTVSLTPFEIFALRIGRWSQTLSQPIMMAPPLLSNFQTKVMTKIKAKTNFSADGRLWEPLMWELT